MPLKGYWASKRLGGTTGASDKIDGADLADKDMLALLESTDTARFYWLDDDASGSEGEGITNPDTNPGTKSWLLLGITVPNTGLHILDSNASHDLIIKPGSDLSTDRELTLTTGDAARTITLSGNPTLADWFDQAVKQASSPTFGGLTLAGNLALAANSITGTSVDINNAELQQLSNIGAATISGAQWGYLGAAGAGGGQLLAALTTGESTQLEAIGATTISSTQWGYLGACGTGGGQLLAALTTGESDQLELIGATTISATQWGYLGGATANGGALIDAADYAAMRTLLDLEAGTDFYSKSAEDTWRNSVSQTEMGYLDGVTGDIQTALDIRCLESVFGTSVSTGLTLDGTALKASTVLQVYHGINPVANVQSLLGAANYAAMMALLSGTATAEFLFNTQQVGGVVDPTTDQQAATKKYVDDHAVTAHAILDGSVHSDSLADAVTRGSIIYGNATPKWDELVIGAADTFLGSDGTDVSYRTAAQVLASLSGEAGAAFAWNSQNLTGVGMIGCGTITIADAGSLLLQEDISFFGATTINRIKFPDNLANALALQEASNLYQSFVTTNGSEAVVFHKNVGMGGTPDGELTIVATTAPRITFSPATHGQADNGGIWFRELYTHGIPGDGDEYGHYLFTDGSTNILHLDAFSNGVNMGGIAISRATGDVNIHAHDAATVGLKLGGTLVTASAAEINALDGISANGTSFIQAANYAAMMALLTGEAGAAFSFNGQNLTALGTLATAAGTLTIDETVALSAKAPLASPSFTGTPLAPDHGAAATDMLINVAYGTGAAPAANTVTEGGIYIKYVA